MGGSATGAVIVFTGDKVIRPILIGSSTQLGFAWVLMGTLGGLELLGFIRIFVGPVVLALAGALWSEHTTRNNRDRSQVTTGTVPAAGQQVDEANRPIANFASGAPSEADYLVPNSQGLRYTKQEAVEHYRRAA